MSRTAHQGFQETWARPRARARNSAFVACLMACLAPDPLRADVQEQTNDPASGGDATSPPTDGQSAENASQDARQRSAPADAFEPVRVRAVRFEGVSGALVSEETLRQLSVPAPADDADSTRVLHLAELAGEDGLGTLLDAGALGAIVAAVSQTYIDEGFAAVRATIQSDSITRLYGPGSDGVLVLHVIEGRVAEVDSRRAEEGSELDEARRERIRRRSPVQAGEAVDLEEITRYIDFLNRHARRRVDLAISPGEEPGQVALEYVVHESKPWTAYLQLTNTGTEQTSELREQFGFVHTDLTDADDTLALSYVTGDFESSHGASLSYERPFDGAPRWKWRLYTDWSEYDASEVGLPGLSFEGATWSFGGELTWNFYQERARFFDLVGGVRFRHAETENAFAALSGEADFVLPYLGMRISERGDLYSFSGYATVEFNLSGALGVSHSELQRLGRTNASRDAAVLRYGLSHSVYLDGYFADNEGEESHAALRTNELAVSARGQYVFGDERLAPTDTDAIGGFYSVRGYPEVLISGDNSFVASLELRHYVVRGLEPDPSERELFGHPFRFRPQQPGGAADWELTLRAFVDVGHVWANERLSFEDNATLAGAGIGAELLVFQNISLRADYGVALKDAAGVDRGSSELHFSLTALF